jgi:hypothetical protein
MSNIEDRLTDQNHKLDRIIVLLVGDVDANSVGLTETIRDHEHRLKAVETRRLTHRSRWWEVLRGVIYAAIGAIVGAIVALFKHKA